MATRLTAARVQRLRKPGRYSDQANGLHLLVTRSGSRQWVQRIVIRGRRRDLGLGPWPMIDLQEARDRAHANRKRVLDGGDPLAEKRKARTPTFREAAQKVFEANRPRWRSQKTATNFSQQLEKHAHPIIGNLPVDQITREHVLRILTPLWGRQLDVSRKLRGRIRATLAWAQAHGHLEHNVAGEAIDGALPPMPAIRAHYRALPHAEVAAALATIEASPSSLSVQACLRFVILTACRSGEARLARWAEIDLDARVWAIPAHRAKTNTEHRVPLSQPVLDLLEQVRPLRDEAAGDLVFESPLRAGKPLSPMTLTKVLRDCGLAERATVHGFRSTFRDWCADRGTPREVAEAALAHVVQGVEGAYLRTTVFERRRRLMDDWAAYVTGAVAGKLVTFPTAGTG